MKTWLLAGILAALAIPQTATATPEAPMTPEQMARDREIIRNLNLRRLASAGQQVAVQPRQQEAASVAQKEYEAAYDDYVQQRADYLRRRNAYEGSMDTYSRQLSTYEADHATWRRSVEACVAGDSSSCGN